MGKSIKEMSKDELLDEIKAASNFELMDNIDDESADVSNTEINTDDANKLNDDFDKFTKIIKKYKKTMSDINEFETINKDNIVLQEYIKLIKKSENLLNKIDLAKKGYLYESAIKVPNAVLDNDYVKVTLTLPYKKKEFNVSQFEKDYSPDTDMYKKYVSYKTIKGNLKYVIKEC